MHIANPIKDSKYIIDNFDGTGKSELEQTVAMLRPYPIASNNIDTFNI
jgi:hypothetical protein